MKEWVFEFLEHKRREVRSLLKHNRVRAFIQRGRRGWADTDLWGLDWYLAEWLPGALRRLAKTTHCYPGNWGQDKKGISEVGTYEDWQKTLENMAAGFEAFIKYDDETDMKKRKALWKKYLEGVRLFAKYFPHLWG